MPNVVPLRSEGRRSGVLRGSASCVTSGRSRRWDATEAASSVGSPSLFRPGILAVSVRRHSLCCDPQGPPTAPGCSARGHKSQVARDLGHRIGEKNHAVRGAPQPLHEGGRRCCCARRAATGARPQTRADCCHPRTRARPSAARGSRRGSASGGSARGCWSNGRLQRGLTRTPRRPSRGARGAGRARRRPGSPSRRRPPQSARARTPHFRAHHSLRCCNPGSRTARRGAARCGPAAASRASPPSPPGARLAHRRRRCPQRRRQASAPRPAPERL